MKTQKSRFIILVSLILMFTSVESQTVNVNGHAFLESQEYHNGIKVKFERIAPTFYADSTLTDSSGYYNTDIEQGIYSITYSKDGFLTIQTPDCPLYHDTILPNQTLQTLGLNGPLSGELLSGVYKVDGNIYVPENETLIIDPGTELEFKQDRMFQVFGTLIAEGTNNDSIKFTHYNNGEYWKGIDFKENSSDRSIMDYCIVEYSNDRGISVYKCSPNISNSLIQNNIYNSSVSGQDEDDGGGAGICLKFSNTLLKNCIIKNNTGVTIGVGVFCNDGNPHISNSLIYNNVNQQAENNIRPGGGIYCSYDVNLTIENCVIAYNSNSIGGGICVSGFDNIFIPTVMVTNCIIFENSAPGDYSFGGGIATMHQTSLSVLNSLIWNNEGGNFSCDDPWLGVNVTTNNNSDSCDAYQNLILDPLFINPSSEDFTLNPESPCIDAGNNSYVTSMIDFAHNCRIWDGNDDSDTIVDMGCYEYGSELYPVGISENSKNPLTRVFAFPNPVYNKLNINIRNISKVEIYDISGRKILKSNKEAIDVSRLRHGLYIIKVQDNNKVYYSEMILKY